MRKKTGLAFELHDRFGLELQTINDRLIEIATQISDHYPKRSRMAKKVEKAYIALLDLRNELDEAVCTEHGHRTDINPAECYYRTSRDDYIKDPQPIRPFPQVH